MRSPRDSTPPAPSVRAPLPCPTRFPVLVLSGAFSSGRAVSLCLDRRFSKRNFDVLCATRQVQQVRRQERRRGRPLRGRPLCRTGPQQHRSPKHLTTVRKDSRLSQTQTHDYSTEDQNQLLTVVVGQVLSVLGAARGARAAAGAAGFLREIRTACGPRRHARAQPAGLSFCVHR